MADNGADNQAPVTQDPANQGPATQAPATQAPNAGTAASPRPRHQVPKVNSCSP